MDPSLLGTYHGAPPLLHPSVQVCVVYSNGMYIIANNPPIESPPHIEVPPFGELLPQEFPEHPTTPLIPDFPPLHGENIDFGDNTLGHYPNSLFYPPPRVQAFQVAATLTLPNMVLSIPVWYLHPPTMVPTPSLPPQIEGLTMYIPIQALATPPSPPTSIKTTTTRDRRKKIKPIAALPP
jgi:hypothetical protein